MPERKLLPIIDSAVNPCGNCNGACCRAGTAISLSDEERAFFEEGGADMLPTGIRTKSQVEAELRERLGGLMDLVAGIVTDAPDNPEYFMVSDCPYLMQNELGGFVCSVYEDPRKPQVCSSFPAGGERCIEMKDLRSSQPLKPPAGA